MELKDQIIKGDILKLNILKTNALHELFKKRENKFLFFSFFGFIHFFFFLTSMIHILCCHIGIYV